MSFLSLKYLQGKEQNKPEPSPLYIQNPFEQALNISKNVNQSQLDRFVALARECAWILQQEDKGHSSLSNSQPWGLAALLLPSVASNCVKVKKRRKGPASERIKSLLDSLKINNANSLVNNGGKRTFSNQTR